MWNIYFFEKASQKGLKTVLSLCFPMIIPKNWTSLTLPPLGSLSHKPYDESKGVNSSFVTQFPKPLSTENDKMKICFKMTPLGIVPRVKHFNNVNFKGTPVSLDYARQMWWNMDDKKAPVGVLHLCIWCHHNPSRQLLVFDLIPNSSRLFGELLHS